MILRKNTPTWNDINLWDDSFIKGFFSPNQGHQATVPVNIIDLEDGIELQIVAPGLTKDMFKVKVENEVLEVAAELPDNLKESTPLKGNIAFRPTSFSKKYKLEKNLNTEQVEARYESGILYIKLKKIAEPEITARTIEIH